MLVGLFEPVGGPWTVDGIPDDVAFAALPPDWERMAPYPRARDGSVPGAARRWHEEVLLRAGELHAGPGADAGRGARAARLLRRRRAELARHPARRRRRQRDRAVDRRRDPARRRDRFRRRPDAAVRDQPALPRRPHRRAARRAVRRLCLAELASEDRAQRPPVGHPRPARRGRRVLRRSRPAGSTRTGSPRTASPPEPTLGWHRDESFPFQARGAPQPFARRSG